MDQLHADNGRIGARLRESAPSIACIAPKSYTLGDGVVLWALGTSALSLHPKRFRRPGMLDIRSM